MRGRANIGRIPALLLALGLLPAALGAQSRLPPNPNNWLQNASTTGNGDVDRVNVIFFEVPDTVTSTLYFAVRDPGTDGTSPDQNNGVTDFYLVGGSGTLSNPNSRLRDYSANQALARTGTTLSSYIADLNAAYNNLWYYFPQGVSPSQGEHIGNKYLFKIAVEETADVEVTDFTCRAEGAGYLGGRYFRLSSPTVDYYAWYNTDGGSTDPSAANAGRTGIPIPIASGDTDVIVATKTAAALSGVGGGAVFNAFKRTTTVVEVRNLATGTATNATAGNIALPFSYTLLQDGGTGAKNAYQVDLSYSSSGTPTGVSGVRSFAYSWTVCYQDGTQIWDFYPFVPENANATSSLDTDYVVFFNYDQDNDETNAANARTDAKTLAAPAASGQDVMAATAYNLYDTNQLVPAADERNGTWHQQTTETNGGIPQNSTEVWFGLDADGVAPWDSDTSPGTRLLRAYAVDFDGVSSLDPNLRVALTYQDGIALADNTDLETVYLQIVDGSGDPVNLSRLIYVTLSDPSAVIDSISAGTIATSTTALITTDAFGLGFLNIRRPINGANDGESFPVTVTAYWDGTGGSSSFGTASSGKRKSHGNEGRK